MVEGTFHDFIPGSLSAQEASILTLLAQLPKSDPSIPGLVALMSEAKQDLGRLIAGQEVAHASQDAKCEAARIREMFE